MGAILGVFGKVGALIAANLVASLMTEKVIMRILLILGDKLVNSTSTSLDNDIFKPVKDAIEKDLEKK